MDEEAERLKNKLIDEQYPKDKKDEPNKDNEKSTTIEFKPEALKDK